MREIKTKVMKETMSFQEVSQIIEDILMDKKSEGYVSQDDIDDVIWDVIGNLDNEDELWNEIISAGAFGWLFPNSEECYS